MSNFYLDLQDDAEVRLGAAGEGGPERVHCFSRAEIDAVNAALGAGRPLLLRGEPGVGKTQLAEAAAARLERVLLPFTVDSRSESHDLLWHLDTVQRLADAQILGASGLLRPAADPGPPDTDPPDPVAVRRALAALRQTLALEHYLHPGPLWWAFHWADAAEQAARIGVEPPAPEAPAAGCLVLIDEIDKAESDLPNGLLEALGARAFTPQGRGTPVRCGGTPPLVIVTTNEERVLPDAFVRRCLVLHLRLPDEDPKALMMHLIRRGRAHFPEAPADLLGEAARQLAADRAAARDNQWYPLPGQAEYLDLVRAALALATEARPALAWLRRLRAFALRKHPDAARRTRSATVIAKTPDP